MLGPVHRHAPHLWGELPADSTTWWFETSTTRELSRLLLDSHQLRVQARKPDRIGLLDRGHPMLIATAVATCAVKDELAIDEAYTTILQIQDSYPTPPDEFAMLLLISCDAQRSIAIAQSRDTTPWTARYLRYQQILHTVLMRQAEHGVYDHIVEGESQSPAEVHRDLIAAVECALDDKD